MDLINFINNLENNGFNRKVEHIKAVENVDEKDASVWYPPASITGVTLTVDDDEVTLRDLWKLCLLENRDGVLFLFVLQVLGGSVVVRFFDLGDVVGIGYLS